MDHPERDFRARLERKRRGGVALDVGVSRGIWMGGVIEQIDHEPIAYVGPADWESDEELTFLPDRASVDALVARLRAAADEAFGPEDDA